MSEPARGTHSPNWNTTTKVIVVIFAILAVIWLAGRFKSLIGMLVVAAILGYLLIPVINFFDQRLTIRRGIIIGIVYIVLALALLAGFSALGFATFQQVANLITIMPELIQDVGDFFITLVNRTEPLQIGPILITPAIVPWDRITQQLLGLLDPVLTQSTAVVSRFATSTARTLFNLFFVFIISLYMSTDLPNLGRYVKSVAQQPGYREDVERIIPELSRVWRAYLRGQIILGLVIFVVVWVGLTLLGVQNSLALGLIAGLLEFVPTVGPVISTIIAMGVAIFQQTNYMGLSSWQFALVVLILMVVIQQVENNFLVPRIVGGALDLHPLLVILGVFMGASLAGILGAILAAPVIASLKILGQYTWRKLFDLPPFPEVEPPPELPEGPPPPAAIDAP